LNAPAHWIQESMMPRKLLLCLAATAALTACKGEATAPADTAATAATQAPAAVGHAFSPEINAADFGELVKTLASDDFEGRAPGSKGEELTVNYIRDQMQRIGLQPIGNQPPASVLRVAFEGIAAWCRSVPTW